MAVLSAPFSWLALLLPVWLGAPPPGLPTAVGMRADQVLLGTERGLYREGSSGWTLVLGRGGVRDLAYTPRGTLIATARGLYEWPLDASAPRALLLGSGARVGRLLHLELPHLEDPVRLLLNLALGEILLQVRVVEGVRADDVRIQLDDGLVIAQRGGEPGDVPL